MPLLEERHRAIIEIVTRDGKVTVEDIGATFGVSEATARRDLRELDRAGLLRRVHGGAVSSLGRSYEPPYHLRATQSTAAKRAIGRKAADLILDGNSIALDVGTTTLEVARALHDRHNLTIVTSSLRIADEIVANLSLGSDIRLILTGGIIRAEELSMIGQLAETAFRTFHVDKAFVGVGGISLTDGLTEYNLDDARVKQGLLDVAQQRIVVTEGAKFGRTTFATVGPLSSIDMVITDDSAPEDMVAALIDSGIEVVIANTDDA
jgi:DeoR/GlpR family transcriptional regulator of sugar metabolism